MLVASQAEFAVATPFNDRARVTRLGACVASGDLTKVGATVGWIGIAIVAVFAKVEGAIATPGDRHRGTRSAHAGGGGARKARFGRFAVTGTAISWSHVAVVAGFIADHLRIAADDSALAGRAGRRANEEGLYVAKTRATIARCGVAVVTGFSVAQIAIATVLIEHTGLPRLGTIVARLKLATSAATVAR